MFLMIMEPLYRYRVSSPQNFVAKRLRELKRRQNEHVFPRIQQFPRDSMQILVGGVYKKSWVFLECTRRPQIHIEIDVMRGNDVHNGDIAEQIDRVKEHALGDFPHGIPIEPQRIVRFWVP